MIGQIERANGISGVGTNDKNYRKNWIPGHQEAGPREDENSSGNNTKSSLPKSALPLWQFRFFKADNVASIVLLVLWNSVQVAPWSASKIVGKLESCTNWWREVGRRHFRHGVLVREVRGRPPLRPVRLTAPGKSSTRLLPCCSFSVSDKNQARSKNGSGIIWCQMSFDDRNLLNDMRPLSFCF